jgi:hypothetical protein
MKPSLLLPIPALALLLSSCVVDHGGYGYDPGYYPGYYDGYYGGGYYSGAYYVDHHHHRGSGRIYGKPWSSYDDVRLNANHRTSPNYRDPHNGGISHNHDAGGNRIDSRGHPVDASGNHIESGPRAPGTSHIRAAGPPRAEVLAPVRSDSPRFSSSPPSSSNPSVSTPAGGGGAVRNDKASHAQSRR